MNRSAGQTNRVNCEAVLGRFVCTVLWFIPHEPRKKTLIPYIYMLPSKTLSKIRWEKLWIQIPPSNRNYNLMWCKSLRMWFAQLPETTCWLCSLGVESKIVAWFNVGDCKYKVLSQHRGSGGWAQEGEPGGLGGNIRGCVREDQRDDGRGRPWPPGGTIHRSGGQKLRPLQLRQWAE